MSVTVQQIITDVRAELVAPVPGFWSDAELMRNIYRAELDYVRRIKCLERYAFMTTTVGVNNYPLPADCLTVRAVYFNEPTDTTPEWFRVGATNLEKISQERPDYLDTGPNNQATPIKYWIWGRYIYLFPAPDTSTPNNLYIFYKCKLYI